MGRQRDPSHLVAQCCDGRLCRRREDSGALGLWDGIGRAFQLVDDLLDLIGDETIGKPRALMFMKEK